MKPMILYEQVFQASELSTAKEAAGFPVGNIANRRTFKRWRSTDATNQIIQINLGSARAANAVGIAGHNLGSITAQISVFYWDGGAYQPVAPPVEITQDRPYIGLFDPQTSDQWQIGLSSMNAIPELGVLLLGNRFAFERYLRAGYDPDAETVRGQTAQSQTLNFLGSVVRGVEQFPRPRWQNLPPDWVKASWDPVWQNHIGLGEPFLWSWDHTNHSDRVQYVHVPLPATRRTPYDPTRRSLSLDLRGVRE